MRIIYYISGLFKNCDSADYLPGAMCTNQVQDILLVFFYVLALPFTFVGASPNMSTFGPIGVSLFWIGGLIGILLLGALIAWIIYKIKKNNLSIVEILRTITT